MNNNNFKLTPTLVGVLEVLSEGELLYIDSYGIHKIGDRTFADRTRKTLTRQRLIERKDKTKRVETRGNGFIISKKGLKVLEEYKSKNSKKKIGLPESQANIDKAPTKAQLDYAKKLKIDIPNNATRADLSCLITIARYEDRPCTDRHKKFATDFGIYLSSKYIGKKGLFNIIKDYLEVPGRELELISWFVFRIYRGMVKGKLDVSITTPFDPIIKSIAYNYLNDEKVISSIMRYNFGEDFIYFGQFTSPDGNVYYGGNKQTLAYRILSEEINNKLLVY